MDDGVKDVTNGLAACHRDYFVINNAKNESYGGMTKLREEMSGAKTFNCKPCQLGFLDRRLLLKHYYHKHVKPNRKHLNVVLCLKCRTPCENKLDLKRHRKLMHEKAEAVKLKCPQCKFMTDDQQYLKRHVRKVHCEPRFPCILCDAIFKRKDCVERHLTQVHRKIRDFLCLLCGKGFADRRSLNRHQEGPHRYECELCEMRFSIKGDLKQHMVDTHPDTVEGLADDGENANQMHEDIGQFSQLKTERF